MKIIHPERGTQSKILELLDATDKAQCFVTIIENVDDEKKIGKRLHDARGALERFRLAAKALEEGYRFDDKQAEKLIAALSQAVKILHEEFQTIEKVVSKTGPSS